MITVKVARKWVEAEGIAGFELTAADGGELPPFDAGSHIDVHLGNGLIRQYSLCNAPGETHRYQLAVLKDSASRGGSLAMHDAVREGGLLEISAPKNLFPMNTAATRSLLFAGGIGITPVIAMAESLMRDDADFTLHYHTRSRDRTAFRERILATVLAGRTVFHCDEAANENTGSMHPLRQPEPGLHLYVCGPAGFIDYIVDSAQRFGWHADNIHTERFSAMPVATGSHAFEIRLARSQRTVQIASQQTVVAALALAGIDIPVSCEQGICGTCLTPVLEGIVDHHDSYLTADEQSRHDQFLPCCSRAKSAFLVLDL